MSSSTKTIYTLGPSGTYSDIASKYFQKNTVEDYNIVYYPSIEKVLKTVSLNGNYAVVPIENFSEGFIPLVVDYLISRDIYIVREIILPIEFSFIGSDNKDLKKIFVQFVAKGQCTEFLERFGGVEVVSTESNIESYEKMKDSPYSSGAIVPTYFVSDLDFPSGIHRVNDHPNNQTRFLVLSNTPSDFRDKTISEFRTSIVIISDQDTPGTLQNILKLFTNYGVNLASIMSRPTKTKFGSYNFYIEIIGHHGDENIKSAITDIEDRYTIKVVGAYPKEANPIAIESI